MSAELDREVGIRVMGWTQAVPWSAWWNDKGPVAPEDWSPSTSMHCAWRVLEKMESIGFSVSVNNHHEPGPSNWPWGWVAEIGDFRAEANTAPEAICIASLAAVAQGGAG